MDRTQAPAYQGLLHSSKRLLKFIEREIAPSDDGTVTLFDDELAAVGSRRVYMDGARLLHGLGFVVYQRSDKQSTFGLCDDWRKISQREAALIVAEVCKPGPSRQRKPPLPTQPAA